jgi:hypothetical protein
MKTIHRILTGFALTLLFLAVAAGAPAAGAGSAGSLKILSPENGAHLDAGEAYPLQYEVLLGAGDDHFHVWVDADRGPGVHTLKGTYTLPKLTPGEHVITLKLVDKGHVPTGPQTSIRVTAK